MAPQFELLDSEGRDHKLTGNALLVFFKVSCPTCQLTLPFLERLYEGSAPGSPAILGISQDGETDTREFQEAFGITFPTLIESRKQGYPVSNAYGITSVPSMFLVDRNGKISWAINGFHRAELDALALHFSVPIFRPSDRVPAMRPG